MSNWISVSERLPEVEMPVLLSVQYNNNIYHAVTIGHLHQPGDSRRKPYFNWIANEKLENPKVCDFHHTDYICPGSEYVVAWMPLPEPFIPQN